VQFHDPFVPVVPAMREHAEFAGRRSTPLNPKTLAACDVALIVTDHTTVDYEMVVRAAPLVIDTRNACARVPAKLTKEKVVKA
jgi:UDP-N-acetyl-D-glucosamine dehydrogenase